MVKISPDLVDAIIKGAAETQYTMLLTRSVIRYLKEIGLFNEERLNEIMAEEKENLDKITYSPTSPK
jgi:hypothetical protein